MLTESGPHVEGNVRPAGRTNRVSMGFFSTRIVAAAAIAAALIFAAQPILAQSADPKAGNQRQQSGEADGQKKVDEFAEAAEASRRSGRQP